MGRFFVTSFYCVNDPINMVDPDGDFANLAGALLWGLAEFFMVDMTQSFVAAGLAKGLAGKNVCFTADTEILTMTGEVPIQYIEAGDIVWSMDMETGEIRLAKVSRAFQCQAPEIVTVTVAGEGIETTTEHPFWVAGKGWTAAKDLRLCDEVITFSGELLDIENISIVAAPTPVYNFEVEGTHTYYVSGSQVLVHNTCNPKTKVSDILKKKKGSIKNAPLPKGSPSWNQISKRY